MRPRTPLCTLASAALLATSLGGCTFLTAKPQARGNEIAPDQLAELVPGVSTRDDVTAALGSPTLHASFDDNTWLYIGERTRSVVAGSQRLISQRTVAVTFDAKGKVRSIAVATGKDSFGHTMLARVTPSPGSQASLMQQILGNVGNYNAAGQQAPNTVGTAASGSGDVGSDSSRFSTGQ